MYYDYECSNKWENRKYPPALPAIIISCQEHQHHRKCLWKLNLGFKYIPARALARALYRIIVTQIFISTGLWWFWTVEILIGWNNNCWSPDLADVTWHFDSRDVSVIIHKLKCFQSDSGLLSLKYAPSPVQSRGTLTYNPPYLHTWTSCTHIISTHAAWQLSYVTPGA